MLIPSPYQGAITLFLGGKDLMVLVVGYSRNKNLDSDDWKGWLLIFLCWSDVYGYSFFYKELLCLSGYNMSLWVGIRGFQYFTLISLNYSLDFSWYQLLKELVEILMLHVLHCISFQCIIYLQCFSWVKYSYEQLSGKD